MAENKKSFVLYCEIIESVKKLTDQQAGKLFKTILMYVNDENPVVDNILIDLVFETIKQNLKRDLKRWERIQQVRAEAGSKGGKKSGEIRGELSKSKANEANASFCEANEAVNVNVNGNVNVINTPFIPQREKEIDFQFLELIEEDWKPLVKYWIEYKKEKRQAYRGMIGLKTMFLKLKKLSSGNLSEAKKIVEIAIAGNYPSFSELKSESKKTKGYTFGEMTLQINGSVKQDDFEKKDDGLYYRKQLQNQM